MGVQLGRSIWTVRGHRFQFRTADVVSTEAPTRKRDVFLVALEVTLAVMRAVAALEELWRWWALELLRRSRSTTLQRSTTLLWRSSPHGGQATDWILWCTNCPKKAVVVCDLRVAVVAALHAAFMPASGSDPESKSGSQSVCISSESGGHDYESDGSGGHDFETDTATSTTALRNSRGLVGWLIGFIIIDQGFERTRQQSQNVYKNRGSCLVVLVDLFAQTERN